MYDKHIADSGFNIVRKVKYTPADILSKQIATMAGMVKVKCAVFNHFAIKYNREI